MSDITNQDLKELILAKFNELDKKVEVGFAELKGEIKRIDEKLIGIDKRLGNEEFIVRGGIVIVFGGLVTAFVKQIFFS
jgi:hypothetical protein